MRPLTLVLLICALSSSCASPIEGLWPPPEGTATHRIVVGMDDWHSLIGVWPEDDPDGEDESGLREWGFADRNFYLMRDDGCCGTTGALFWPTEGVLRVAPAGQSLYESSGHPPPLRWTFELSAEGHRRLLAFLASAKARNAVISTAAQSEWYPAAASYSAFHHCNHWTARALRAAGLPVWSTYALFRWSMVWQLDRAAGWTIE